MNDLLAQIILAARNNDVEGWMSILVVVVLAVFWAIGGILKAKTKKPANQDEEQLPRKPAGRPPERSRVTREELLKRPQRPVGPPQRRKYRPGVQQPATKIAVRRPAARKLAAEAEQAPLKTIEPTLKPELSLPEPQIRPGFEELPELEAEIQELPEFTSKTVEGLVGKREGMPAEFIESRYLSEVLSDYADPDELRRAIIHYEILGRPLSLRGPSGQIIGL